MTRHQKKEVIPLSLEDRTRAIRLQEEIIGRLEELHLITTRTRGQVASAPTSISFTRVFSALQVDHMPLDGEERIIDRTISNIHLTNTNFYCILFDGGKILLIMLLWYFSILVRFGSSHTFSGHLITAYLTLKRVSL